VLWQKRRKAKGLAKDPEIKQLAKGLRMLVKELLEELLAMLANNKAIEVRKRQEGVPATKEGEDINKFLKARTVDLYIAAVL
jgi:hypothetical protein